VDLAEVARLTADAGLPVTIAACAYVGARTLAVLTALYGSEKLSRRAREVLRLLRRDRDAR
jgi:hypothetical protein